MSFHLFFINGWGFESNFWKPTCDLLNLKDIVSSVEILDKNSLNKKVPKKIPINTIFITHSMGLNFFLEMKVDCLALINIFSAPNFLGFEKDFDKSKKSFDLMLNKFEEEPDKVLRKFFYNCGLHDNYFPENKIDYKKTKKTNSKLHYQIPPERDIRDTQPTISVNYRVVKSNEDKDFKYTDNSYEKDKNDDWDETNYDW